MVKIVIVCLLIGLAGAAFIDSEEKKFGGKLKGSVKNVISAIGKDGKKKMKLKPYIEKKEAEDERPLIFEEDGKTMPNELEETEMDEEENRTKNKGGKTHKATKKSSGKNVFTEMGNDGKKKMKIKSHIDERETEDDKPLLFVKDIKTMPNELEETEIDEEEYGTKNKGKRTHKGTKKDETLSHLIDVIGFRKNIFEFAKHPTGKPSLQYKEENEVGNDDSSNFGEQKYSQREDKEMYEDKEEVETNGKNKIKYNEKKRGNAENEDQTMSGVKKVMWKKTNKMNTTKKPKPQNKNTNVKEYHGPLYIIGEPPEDREDKEMYEDKEEMETNGKNKIGYKAKKRDQTENEKAMSALKDIIVKTIKEMNATKKPKPQNKNEGEYNGLLNFGEEQNDGREDKEMYEDKEEIETNDKNKIGYKAKKKEMTENDKKIRAIKDIVAKTLKEMNAKKKSKSQKKNRKEREDDDGPSKFGEDKDADREDKEMREDKEEIKTKGKNKIGYKAKNRDKYENEDDSMSVIRDLYEKNNENYEKNGTKKRKPQNKEEIEIIRDLYEKNENKMNGTKKRKPQNKEEMEIIRDLYVKNKNEMNGTKKRKPQNKEEMEIIRDLYVKNKNEMNGTKKRKPQNKEENELEDDGPLNFEEKYPYLKIQEMPEDKEEYETKGENKIGYKAQKKDDTGKKDKTENKDTTRKEEKTISAAKKIIVSNIKKINGTKKPTPLNKKEKRDEESKNEEEKETNADKEKKETKNKNKKKDKKGKKGSVKKSGKGKNKKNKQKSKNKEKITRAKEIMFEDLNRLYEEDDDDIMRKVQEEMYLDEEDMYKSEFDEYKNNDYANNFEERETFTSDDYYVEDKQPPKKTKYENYNVKASGKNNQRDSKKVFITLYTRDEVPAYGTGANPPRVKYNKETVFLIHGVNKNQPNYLDNFFNDTVNALLIDNDCNVLTIDWSRLTLKEKNTDKIKSNVNIADKVGEILGRIINLIRGYSKSGPAINLIGHDLGTVAIARAVTVVKRPIEYIYGLNQRYFKNKNYGFRYLREDMGKLVQTVNTNDFPFSMTHRDFYPKSKINGKDRTGDVSYKLFAKDIRTEGGRFVSTVCPSYSLFKAKKCRGFPRASLWNKHKLTERPTGKYFMKMPTKFLRKNDDCD